MVLEQLLSQLSVPAMHSLISVFVRDKTSINNVVEAFSHKLTVTLPAIAVKSVSRHTVARIRSVAIEAIMLTVVYVSGTFIHIFRRTKITFSSLA